MSPAEKTFSAEDLRFLDDHFQVYDPKKGCHANFGVLQGCRVVILADRYQSGTLAKSQEAFFNRFAGAEDCILLENFAPGEQVPSKECLERWPSLPGEIEVRGSDVRALGKDREKFQACHQLFRRKWSVQVETSAKIHLIQQTIGFLITQDILASRAFVEKETVVLPPSTLNVIHQLESLTDKLVDQYNAFQYQLKLISQGVSWALRESNAGLARCIVQTAADPRIKKIIPLWGMHHFFEVEAVFKELETHKISYCVLFPSKKKLVQIDDELNRSPDLKLKVGSSAPESKGKVGHLTLSPVSLKGFLPTLHSLFKSGQIWVTAEWLEKYQSVTLPAEFSLCFPVNLNDEQVEAVLSETPVPLVKLFEDTLKSLKERSGRHIRFDQSKLSVHVNFDARTCSHYISCMLHEATRLEIVDA